METNLLMLLEILLMGYLLFNYKKIINKFNNKSIIIFMIIFIRNIINYNNISFSLAIIIDILYSVFLVYLVYIIYKDK